MNKKENNYRKKFESKKKKGEIVCAIMNYLFLV
jgi:hypothetical protein